MTIGDRVPELGQHREAAPRQLEAPLGRLIRIGHARERDDLRLPALRREALAQQLGRALLHQDARLEVEPRREAEVLVRGARSCASRARGEEGAGRGLDVDDVAHRPGSTPRSSRRWSRLGAGSTRPAAGAAGRPGELPSPPAAVAREPAVLAVVTTSAFSVTMRSVGLRRPGALDARMRSFRVARAPGTRRSRRARRRRRCRGRQKVGMRIGVSGVGSTSTRARSRGRGSRSRRSQVGAALVATIVREGSESRRVSGFASAERAPRGGRLVAQRLETVRRIAGRAAGPHETKLKRK